MGRKKKKKLKETFHILSGVNEEGKRKVLGFYLNPEGGSNFYNEVFEDLKILYKSSNKEEALKNYELFRLKWEKMYPSIVKNLDKILEYFLTFYEFPG